MADQKTPSETPTQPVSDAAPAASASASTAAPTTSPKIEPLPAKEAKPPVTGIKAGTPVATEAPSAEVKEPVAPAPDPAAPATGVNEDEATALAKAAADKAAADKVVADKAAADAKALADSTAVPEAYTIEPPAAIAEAMKKSGLTIDPNVLSALTPALKAAKLTQSQFNVVAGAFLEFQGAQPQRMMARDMEITKADPVIGGLNYARSMEEVTVALDAFADPDFKKFVVNAGIANKLEFVRVFQRIGAAMRKAGDSPVRSQPDAAPEETRAQRMYGRKKTT
jgi:hypothetical protein